MRGVGYEGVRYVLMMMGTVGLHIGSKRT